MKRKLEISDILGEPPDYLKGLQGGYNLHEFDDIAYEMLQLNNFLAESQNLSDSKVESLQRELGAKRPSEDVVVDEHNNTWAWHDDPSVIPIYHHYLPFWQDIAGFINPATQLLLLYISVEKSLKNLCYFYSVDWRIGIRLASGERIKRIRRPYITRAKNESLFRSYILFLQNDCELDFHCPDAIDYFDLKVRKIRNAFGHGDWDSVTESVQDVCIISAFQCACKLFTAIKLAREAMLSPEADNCPF